jgi:hypothetical protein
MSYYFFSEDEFRGKFHLTERFDDISDLINQDALCKLAADLLEEHIRDGSCLEASPTKYDYDAATKAETFTGPAFFRFSMSANDDGVDEPSVTVSFDDFAKSAQVEGVAHRKFLAGEFRRLANLIEHPKS